MQRGYNFVGRSFGVFNLELPEDYVFCFAGSDKAPESPILAGTSRAVSIDGSFNELALAFSRRPEEVFNGYLLDRPAGPKRDRLGVTVSA
jgi:hypothetical protein